jgi:hypothetical protein
MGAILVKSLKKIKKLTMNMKVLGAAGGEVIGPA